MPTKEQIQWFWEQCGLNEQPSGSWYTDSGEYVYMQIIPIDLNSLFKYAVPKLMEYHKSQSFIGYLQTSTWLMESWVSDWIDSNNSYDPALALFWAIYKAFGGEDVRTQV